MSQLKDILTFNKLFIDKKEYEKYKTSKYPDKKILVLSCMDTRLIELLPKAMNLGNGDIKLIKNAGAVIAHPFGSIMRSIIVAIYELQCEEVFVVGHHSCGMSNVNKDRIVNHMIERGISQEVLDTLNYSGVNLEEWLHGFDSVEASVKESVEAIRKHPLIPKNIKVHGLVMHPETGEITVIVDGDCNEDES